MGAEFVRHRQPWKPEEIAKLHRLAGKGMGLKAIAKALTRSEESVQERPKADGVRIAKLRCRSPFQLEQDSPKHYWTCCSR